MRQTDNPQLTETARGKRIGSIDAIRAFALFGIILVHSAALFCCGKQGTIQSPLDTYVNKVILLVFERRSAMMFMILFGISFYLILRKPSYSSSKFAWRCFLLMLIGFVAKLFYWPDALMCYGLFGMALVLIRHFNIKQLVAATILLYILSTFLASFKWGDYMTPFIPDGIDVRYDSDSSMKEAFLLLPQGIMWYFRVVLNGGIFGILANFSLGYLIGRLGWIEKMDSVIRLKHIAFTFLVYALFFYLKNHITFHEQIMPWIKRIWVISGAIFYSMLIVWFYNHTKLKAILSFFESYGRCGLTNYFMQGVVGVFLLCHCGLAFQHYHFTYIIIGAVLIYLLQAICSYIWLKHFRNGPMEYLWRCATDRKWLPFRK